MLLFEKWELGLGLEGHDFTILTMMRIEDEGWEGRW